MTAEGGSLIAIASGKGGVGKTWLAVTLAQALAQQGRRVLLADGDFGLANVDVQLGLHPERDILGVLAGRVTLEDAVMRHEQGGFDVLPGRSGSGALASLGAERVEQVAGLLRAAAATRDVVLLDLGAGLDAATRRLSALADTLLVVVTDEPTSLTDAYAVVKLHTADRPDGDVRIVVNQATDPIQGRRTAAALQQACRHFLRREVSLSGIVRRDDRVKDAIRRQMPLLSRHPAAIAGADVVALTHDFC
jgi:flagellar biosynthesis protein FlhG